MVFSHRKQHDIFLCKTRWSSLNISTHELRGVFIKKIVVCSFKTSCRRYFLIAVKTVCMRSLTLKGKGKGSLSRRSQESLSGRS